MPQPIFILSAPEDESITKVVRDYLEASGITCAASEEGADSWSIMLLILSANANESEEILRATRAAIETDKILIPIRVENFRPSGPMQDRLRSRYVHDAFAGPLEKHLEELVRMIKPLQHGRSARLSEATSLSRTLPSRAAILQKPVKTEAESRNDLPVDVSLNFPHLVIASHPSIMQCRLHNGGLQPLSDLRLLIECRGLKHEVERSLSGLARGESISLPLEIEPGGFGPFNLQLSLRWQEGGKISNASATYALHIQEAPGNEDFPAVLQQISQKTMPSQKDRLNLPPSIASADELARFKLPDRFEGLPLVPDFEILADSWHRAKTSRSLTIPPEFLDQAQTGSVLLLTPTGAPPDDPHQDLRLVSRPQFVLGRSTEESDYILWFWPRNEVHDTKTRRVSKKHVAFFCDGKHLFATNTAAGSLTTYEGQDITAKGVELQRRGLLNLSGIYVLDVLHSSGQRSSPSISNLADWKGHSLPAAEPGVRGSVMLSPRTAQVLPQNAIWLLSDATFGTSSFNPVAMKWEGLADIQGRFRHERDVFWLESFAENDAVQLNERVLTPGLIAPLSTGQVLRLGTASFSVSVGP